MDIGLQSILKKRVLYKMLSRYVLFKDSFMQNCPDCAFDNTVKNGKLLNHQRSWYKDYSFQFTRDSTRRRSTEEKAPPILLYTVCLSFNAVVRI